MDDLDALLADLQSTTSHLEDGGGGGPQDSYNNSYHYNSSTTYSDKHPASPILKHNYNDNIQPLSPRNNMKEVTVTTTTTTYHQNSPGSVNNSTLNSNLSELDSLLEDLNTSKYQVHPEKRGLSSPIPTSAPSPQHLKSISPTGSIGSNGGLQDNRPTVESLLDELQSAVAPNSPRATRQVVTTTVTTKTSANRPVSPTAGYTLPTSASSATQELDDLMASLSDFKITSAPTPNQATVTDSLYAKPNKLKQPTHQHSPASNNHLDSMLGTLQSDMSRQGINTSQKGCCAFCAKPIVGQVVTALAKTWHPEHFTCIHCKQELATKNFFERDGQPYCETDYHNLFSPRCAYCNGPILDKCVSALDKSWHPEHFFCAQCGNQFGEEGFHEKDGKPYCRDDYFEMFAPKCGGCSRPIMENYISALNTQWHPECFVCRDCKCKLQGGSFYSMEGKPVCSKCLGVEEGDEEEEEEEEA